MKHDRIRVEAQPGSIEDRAQALLNSQIARIDAALSFMRLRKASFRPSIFEGLERGLTNLRNIAEWYLVMPDHGGKTALGMMGANGRGPKIDDLIASVDFHANATRYVPPARAMMEV